MLALTLGLGVSTAAIASAAVPARSASRILFGTLDTQPGTAATEDRKSVTQAMFEFSWASFEPEKGIFSDSYLATMRSLVRAYQAAGMKVTLGLGLQNPPSWVFSLPDSRYVNQFGRRSAEANFVFSNAVRKAADGYLARIAAGIPMATFSAVRLTSGGDGEMLYPGGGSYWAFDSAALTGKGLAAGMTRNPFRKWRPGRPGLTSTQISRWVNWYISGLDNVTGWQMRTLARLGFRGYYETVTPGSGTRPDGLRRDERTGLPNDGTTGVGAVWNRYYAMLPGKSRVVAYVSSVADESGGNDSCQAGDASIPLTSGVMDSWSATRWISRVARSNGLLLGGENPGYGLPASLDKFYENHTSSGMMADALRQASSCGFRFFYWAHDFRLRDGTLPFSLYATLIAGLRSGAR